MKKESLKQLIWIGSSLDDLKLFPKNVQREVGFTLHRVQEGKKPSNVKLLKSLGGVMEIISDYNKNTYRTVYTVKLGNYIYVLHAFQKKSKSGIKTPQQEIDLIKKRLAFAKEHANEINRH